jgi:Carboxypeptidase regulatory-like domain
MQSAGKTSWRVAACVLFAFAFCNLSAAQHPDEGPTAVLNFLVLKDDNGKPIRNAAVIMHEVNARGKQERGDLELKTDADGKASFSEVPYGMLRVQVLASGFQTFGDDYEINKGKVDLTIKLKRPQGQFSLYDTPDKKTAPADPNSKPQ